MKRLKTNHTTTGYIEFIENNDGQKIPRLPSSTFEIYYLNMCNIKYPVYYGNLGFMEFTFSLEDSRERRDLHVMHRCLKWVSYILFRCMICNFPESLIPLLHLHYMYIRHFNSTNLLHFLHFTFLLSQVRVLTSVILLFNAKKHIFTSD